MSQWVRSCRRLPAISVRGRIACAAVIITKDALWGCDGNSFVCSHFSSSNYLEMVEWLMKSAKIGIHTASYALHWAAE